MERNGRMRLGKNERLAEKQRLGRKEWLDPEKRIRGTGRSNNRMRMGRAMGRGTSVGGMRDIRRVVICEPRSGRDKELDEREREVRQVAEKNKRKEAELLDWARQLGQDETRMKKRKEQLDVREQSITQWRSLLTKREELYRKRMKVVESLRAGYQRELREMEQQGKAPK